MTQLRPGQTVKLTDDGRRVTVWSAAPDPGTYWCHLIDDPRTPTPVVLVRVRQPRNAPLPIVTLEEHA